MTRLNKREIPLKELRHWFEEEKRNFPWRCEPTPYRVWVSEVMLQQTQAVVVVPYFERWMERFPSIEALAEASIEEVIKLWEGLGYYARARALHEGARYVMEHHGGDLPMDVESLKKVKGLGPYTIGAIRSFAFHQKAAAVDGNVVRVMSRLLCIEEEVDRPSVLETLRQRVEEFLPDTQPWVMMEALIELGARVCKKKPDCERCPLQDVCMAYPLGKAVALPKKRKRPQTIALQRYVPVICCDGEFLIQRQEGKKVMAGLYEFPYFDKKTSIETFYLGGLQLYKRLKEVKHTFTRYRVELFPSIWKASEKLELNGFTWAKGQMLEKLPFSSGHRRILKQLLEEHADLTY